MGERRFRYRRVCIEDKSSMFVWMGRMSKLIELFTFILLLLLLFLFLFFFLCILFSQQIRLIVVRLGAPYPNQFGI